ncbi:MAG: hypothetical protein R6X34_09490 [Chloroflexota bacterium]
MRGKGVIPENNAVGKTPISLVNSQELLELLIEHGIGVNKEQHTVLSLDEEWWGELIGSKVEQVVEVAEEAETAVVDIVFPVTVQASHDPGLTAQLLNAHGLMLYAGQEYGSPSGAGKAASGWKSTNGWTFWRYQHLDTGEWRAIQELRLK